MGVTLSILGNNTSSLVGVAISASLLPPAVNAGICWMHSLLIHTGAVQNPSNEPFGIIGSISLVLTLVNILCIWVSGVVMFQVKEVAPIKSKSAFWANDIKVARAIKTGNKDIDMDVIKAGLQDAIEKEDKIRRRRRGTDRGSGGIHVGVAGSENDYVTPLPRVFDDRVKNSNKLRFRRLRKNAPSAKATNVNWNMSSGPSIDEYAMEETLLEDVITGPSPLVDQERYIGLEHMASLLGFDDDDDEECEEQDEEERQNIGIRRRRPWDRFRHFNLSDKKQTDMPCDDSFV